jgi:lipid-binding SYLF domain-containing protein
VALDGAVLAVDHDANEKVFGNNVTPRQIFEGRVHDVPGALVEFRDRLEEYTAK